MDEKSFPDIDLVGFAARDYVLPPECCRCNTAPGNSSLKIEAVIGRRGGLRAMKTIAVPICSDCLSAIDRDAKARSGPLRRIFAPIFYVSGALVIGGIALANILDHVPDMLVALIALSFLPLLASGVPLLFAMKYEREKSDGVVRTNDKGELVFGNKEYQARVTRRDETYVPQNYFDQQVRR